MSATFLTLKLFDISCVIAFLFKSNVNGIFHIGADPGKRVAERSFVRLFLDAIHAAYQ